MKSRDTRIKSDVELEKELLERMAGMIAKGTSAALAEALTNYYRAKELVKRGIKAEYPLGTRVEFFANGGRHQVVGDVTRYGGSGNDLTRVYVVNVRTGKLRHFYAGYDEVAKL